MFGYKTFVRNYESAIEISGSTIDIVVKKRGLQNKERYYEEKTNMSQVCKLREAIQDVIDHLTCVRATNDL